MHNKINSFPPITNPNATILILGSMPGIASLEAAQYYAHPRNAFWPIMGDYFGFDPALTYQTRVKVLTAANVALWDVLQQCERHGSLDSAIKSGSRIPNDFGDFFTEHPLIRLIGFNGAEAESSFKKHVLRNLPLAGIKLMRLPSTSPAHTMPFAQKKRAWHLALQSI